jgi:signal transduction histidine kinase
VGDGGGPDDGRSTPIGGGPAPGDQGGPAPAIRGPRPTEVTGAGGHNGPMAAPSEPLPAVAASGGSGRLRLLGSGLLVSAFSLAGLALLVLAVLAAVLVPAWVGVPLTLATVALLRRFAGRHRARAARLLGTAVDRPYRPAPPGGWFSRLKAVGGDPATWRDAAWVLLNATAGTVLRLVPAALLVAALAALAFPAIWPYLPPTDDTNWVGVVKVTGPGAVPAPIGAFLAGFQGLLLLGVWWWASPRLLAADARLARWLLAPTERARLASRVRELAQTRAETVDTQAAELRRIERDLHDGVQARLVSLGMSIGLADELVDRDPGAARELLAEARQATAKALSELREVVRGIHPPVLADRGLDGAVQALALASPLPTEVEVDIPARLPAPVESAAYFAVAESLTNVIKHSRAGRTWVRLRHAGGRLAMEVGDDGRGGADPASGTGILGLRDRAEAVGGMLTMNSPPGRGTVVTATLPLGGR